MSSFCINQELKDQLICKKEDHQEKPLELVCKHQDCNSRLNCVLCLLDDHSDHFINMTLLKTFFEKPITQQVKINQEKQEFLNQFLNNKNPENLLQNYVRDLYKQEREIVLNIENYEKEYLQNSINTIKKQIEKQFQDLKQNFKNKTNNLLQGIQQDKSKEQCSKIKTKSQFVNYLNAKFGKKVNVSNQDYNIYLQSLVILRKNPFQIQDFYKSIETAFCLNSVIKPIDLNINDFAFHRMKLYVPKSNKTYKTLSLKRNIATNHKKSIYRVIFLENEQKFATACDDSTIIIWDTIKGTLIHTFTGHTDRIWAMIKLGDYKLVSGSSDHKIRIWNVKTLQAEKKLIGHVAFVCSLLEMPQDHILSGSHDKTIRVWNTETGQASKIIRSEQQGKIMSMIWLNNNILATGSDSNIHIYDFEKSKIVKTLTGHTALIRDLLLLDDLKTFLSASDDHKIKLWDIDTNVCIRTFTGHTHSSNKLLQFDDQTLVSCSDDATIKFWSIEKGTMLHSLTGHNSWVIFMTIMKDGTLVSVGADKQIRFWDNVNQPNQYHCIYKGLWERNKKDAKNLNQSLMSMMLKQLKNFRRNLLIPWFYGSSDFISQRKRVFKRESNSLRI